MRDRVLRRKIPSQEVVMKLSVIAGLVLYSVLLFAQGVEAPKVHSMTGCLKAGPTPGSYMLTDVAKGPKTVGIVSSTPDLAPPAGPKVEITGTGSCGGGPTLREESERVGHPHLKGLIPPQQPPRLPVAFEFVVGSPAWLHGT